MPANSTAPTVTSAVQIGAGEAGSGAGQTADTLAARTVSGAPARISAKPRSSEKLTSTRTRLPRSSSVSVYVFAPEATSVSTDPSMRIHRYA